MSESTGRTRRQLLRAAATGAAAAGAAVVLGAGSATAADPDDVVGDAITQTTGRTTVRSTTTDDAAFVGQSTGAAVGLFGHSSASAAAPEAVDQSIGVYGTGATGVAGAGATGVYGGGAIAVFGDAFADEAGVYGFTGDSLAPGALPGVGVMAEAGSNAQTALQVIGKARFSRSGRATVAAGSASRVVTLPGVTSTSLAFAVLARNVPSRFIRAVVPGAGKFTVYLNGTVSSATPFAWIVFDPSLV